MSETTLRQIQADNEAAQAALADTEPPPFGSDIGPATTDDEIDDACTAAVRR